MRALLVFVLVVVLVIANVMGDELMADDLKKYQQMTNKLMDKMDVDKPLNVEVRGWWKDVKKTVAKATPEKRCVRCPPETGDHCCIFGWEKPKCVQTDQSNDWVCHG